MPEHAVKSDGDSLPEPPFKIINSDDPSAPIEQDAPFPSGLYPVAGDQIELNGQTYTVMLRRWIDPEGDGTWQPSIFVKLSPKG